jgi:PAS domain S-box-containing protein
VHALPRPGVTRRRHSLYPRRGVGWSSDNVSTAAAALDALSDPVVVCAADGALNYANTAASLLFGEAREALVGRPATSLLPERHRSVAGQDFFEWLGRDQREHPRSIRVPILRHDGLEIRRVVSASIASDGALVLVLRATGGGAEDDPLRVDAELPSPETTYRAVFDSVPVGVLHFDANARITAVNDVLVSLMGSSREVLLGIDLRTLPNLDARRSIEQALAGSEGLFEGKYVSATGGRQRVLRAVSSPIRKDGRVIGGVTIVDDLTEREQIEARLAQGERMASLGRLAAGVAHEINNPLAYARTSLEVARRELERVRQSGSLDALVRVLELIGSADDGIERVRVIVSDLKTFSRGDDGSWAPVELHRVVEAAVNLVWNEVRHRAQLVRELAPAPRVMGSESRFVQVLVNLLVNAAQAIPEGDAQRHRITIRVGPASQERVFVEVEDTGVGIEADRLPNVFEPFSTSKPKGLGTGLGLSICHGIVTSAGGEIRVVKTRPGKGTTFRIELPASVEAADPPSDTIPIRAEDLAQPSSRPRILLVDDEPKLGATLALALRDRYDVVVCTSGRAAIEELSRGDRFDLVLCDLMMPEVSGMEVYARAREIRPDVVPRFAFMTGGAFTARAGEFLREHRVRRIEKPFPLQRVEELLRDA